MILMNVGTKEVLRKTAATYLGIMLECHLQYWKHIKMVCNKASRLVKMLSRLKCEWVP